jgi:hypothetical protein
MCDSHESLGNHTSCWRESVRPNQSIQPIAVHSIHLYALRARKHKRGVDLVSDALPFGRLWYGGPNAAGNAVD